MSAEDAPQAVQIDPPDSTDWHRMLRERDAAVHHDQTEAQVSQAVADLELRLTLANATKHTLEQAIVLRDRLLREQQLRMADLERDLAGSRGGRGPSALSSARRFAATARRGALRIVRSR